jgi:hypothetical protein
LKKKRGNRKSPFVKGALEGFSSGQHDFDETPARRHGEEEHPIVRGKVLPKFKRKIDRQARRALEALRKEGFI